MHTLDSCITRYSQEKHTIGVFANSIREFFITHPTLTQGNLPAIHSVKSRVKNEGNLRDKITRKKITENRDIDATNLLTEITDLGGVRVLHLHKDQFIHIHETIKKHVEDGHWALHEKPTAYTWDPESKTFFESLGLAVLIKESHYTSVHYVVKPNNSSPITCEIQVRTLFEEVWGEIDHVINYPHETGSIACREQLRVLAKMVGAGTRLAEAIFRSHKEFTNKPK